MNRLLAIAVVLGGCATGPTLRTVAQQRAAAVEVAVACADTTDVNGWHLRVGSGVLIDARHVLTAKHVVDCVVQAVLVSTADDALQSGALVEVLLPRNDLARLELREPIDVVGPPLVGAVPAVACASPGYPSRARRCGLVTFLRPGPMQDIGFAAPASEGNSGSAIYDLSGRLVGIVTHRCSTGACTFGTSLLPRAWLVTP